MNTIHEKIYYNVIINGNPREDQYYEPAKFSVLLNQNLIDDASKYVMIVQKFKIDSESIPLFHVQLLQPQPKVVGNIGFVTKYIVYLNYNGVVYQAPLLYNKPYGPTPPIIKTNPDGTVIYDNTNNMFAIYSYDLFLEMVNTAIANVCQQAGISPVPFFEYNGLTEKISFFVPSGFTGQLYFSKSLLPFIGEGFRTTYYFYNPPGINAKVFSIDVRQLSFNTQTVGSNTYTVVGQEHKAISSWASINRVLFTSSYLPITREFFPVQKNEGILVNNNMKSYQQLANMGIISSFLIDSTNAGDHRTSIIYSNQTLDGSDIIEMRSQVPIKNIDIDVHWCDKFGNIYPLFLADGKQVDVRLAFIRR